MDIHVTSIIRCITLNQRFIYCNFRKKTGINRSQLEILAFATTTLCFNPYEVQKHFTQMNLQQVRTGIKKLAIMKAIEMLQAGIRNRPAVYMITKTGKEFVAEHDQDWAKVL